MGTALVNQLFQQQKAKKASQAPVAEEVVPASQLLISAMMPHQLALFRSKSRRDAVIAPRQVGKSFGVLLLVFANCLQHRNQQWVIVVPTLKAGKRIYLPAFRKINKKFGLGIVFNKTDSTFAFPNDSMVYFVGADKSDRIDDIRGGAYDGLVVDESQKYPLAVFSDLIEAVSERALAIRRGRLIVIGTPGEVLQGEFYLATCTPPVLLGEDKVPSNYAVGEKPNALWCKHVWNCQANIAEPHIWEDALQLKKLRGWPDDHPTWLREYLGFWVSTYDVLVYQFKMWANCYDEGALPPLPAGESWKKVLGIDLGAVDGTAMVIWAYSPYHPNIYELYAHKEVKTEEQAIHARFLVEWHNRLAEEFGPFEEVVYDPGGLAGLLVATVEDEYGLVWQRADTREKEDHIALFNDDLDAGRIFIRRNSEYVAEISKNKWRKDKQGFIPPRGRRTEDDGTPNDICDAGLYAFRYCYHRRYHAPAGVAEALDQARALYEQELRRLRDYMTKAPMEVDPCLDLN